MSAEPNCVNTNDHIGAPCEETDLTVTTQCECCVSKCNLPRPCVKFSDFQTIERDNRDVTGACVKYNDILSAERNFVTSKDSFRAQCNVNIPISSPNQCNNAKRDCRVVLPITCVSSDKISGNIDCKTFNQNVAKASKADQVYENSLRLHREGSLKCLNTECCGNSNFVDTTNISLSSDNLKSNSSNTNSLIFNESPNVNTPSDLKCWCNKDDCRMYLDNNYCSDYYVQNSDVTYYENISFKRQEIAPTNKKEYVADNVNLNNECNTYKCNVNTYYAKECSDTDTTTSEGSDESMTSLDSGIKTVIYESASSKDVSSLPHDEDAINKNECAKTHSKSACVLS